MTHYYSADDIRFEKPHTLYLCTDTKATQLLPHTPCSFKECDFPQTTILQTISTVITIYPRV